MLAVAILALLQPSIDPVDLIDRVASRYVAMKEFLVEYRQNAQLPVHMPAYAGRTITIRAAKAGDRYFYSESGDQSFQITGDGETVWHYDIRRKEYIEEPAGLRGDEIARDGLKSAVLRFRMLAGQAMNARFLRMDDRKFQGKRVHCAVIEITTPRSHPFPWVERLWIEPRTAVVYRSEFESTGELPRRGSKKIYREFTLPAGLQNPGSAIFEFRPPKGAKQVDRFSAALPDARPGDLIQ